MRAIVLALLALAAVQDPGARDIRVKEVVRDGAKVRFTAAGDFPDDTIVSVRVSAEPEYMLHAREVRIAPQPAKEAVLERQSAFQGKTFSVQFASPRGAFYLLHLVYNKSAQVLPEVVKTLEGLRDTAWTETLLVLDPDSLPETLEEHHPLVSAWADRAQAMLEKIEKAMADPDKWRVQAPEVLKEVPPLASEAQKFIATTPFHACMDTLIQAFLKMSNFDPGVPKPNFKPGSAEEAMAQSMSEDIPGELSDEFLKKQVRAYLARVRVAILRERLIVPNRILLNQWNVYVARAAHPKATDAEMDGARKAFEEADQGVIRNLRYLQKDRKVHGQIDQKRLQDMEKHGLALAAAAEELRAARGDADRTADAIAKVRKLRDEFTARDRELRLIPK
jgi:hypothetical protein